MKTLPLSLLAIFAFSRAWAAENPVPQPWPADRYAAMSGQSPFALATVTAPPPAPQASFAANWFVSGLGRQGDTDFVTIKSRDAALQFSLFGREPNAEQGVAIASVNWSETIGKSTVILQKGTETAKLEFNEADLRGPAPGAAVPGPNAAAAGGGLRRPGSPPMSATGASGAAINPPAVVTSPLGGSQPAGTKPQALEIRRRERVIPVPR